MRKIIGILVCTLLISTAFPVIGELGKNNIPITGDIDNVPILNLQDPRIFNLQNIPFDLVNTGEGTAKNLTWEMNIIEGDGLFYGKLFSPKEDSGTIPMLGPDDEYTIDIELSGLGITTIYIDCRYTIENLSGCTQEFEVKQEWVVLGIFYINLFLPSMQPDKEWVVIDNYSYFEEKDTDGVELYHEDLLQKHNTRVVEGSKSGETLFLATCKFINGTGVLRECGITEDIVTSGEAHWEVELVDGE